jgi:hypothetical protein
MSCVKNFVFQFFSASLIMFDECPHVRLSIVIFNILICRVPERGERRVDEK